MVKEKKILLVLGLIGSLVWLTVCFFPDDKLSLVFCDVGQGDAILITKGFSQILIDGGPNEKVLSCLSKNMPFFDNKIEIVALTHPEADHLTGLVSVLDKYNVDTFLMGPEGNQSAIFLALEKRLSALIDEQKITVKNVYTNDKISLGSIKVETVWPEKAWVSEKLGSNIAVKVNEGTVGSHVLGVQSTNLKLNQFSLVFLLKYDQKQVLLMGDADQTVQNRILDVYSLMSLDILKFPHHGSKTGMSEKFLEQIKPKIAVISVGKNSYGHPTAEALGLLKKYGVTIRRTDLEGEIMYNF